MIEKVEDIRQGKRAREEKLFRACNVPFSDLISTQPKKEGGGIQSEKEGGNADEGDGLQDSGSAEEAGPSG